MDDHDSRRKAERPRRLGHALNMGVRLVLGGARSGKSAFAEQAAAETGLERHYLATSRIYDDAHAARIELHRQSRQADWILHEEPLDLPGTLVRIAAPDRVVLVDCLTLWLTNLLLDHADIEAAFDALEETIPGLTGPVIFVANEVGLSVAPETKLGNQFRDWAGLLNQRVARLVDRVDFIAAGLPLRLKG